MKKRPAFTVAEVIITSVIASYIFIGATTVFVMSWRWWSETEPRIEAQRVARLALVGILKGYVDSTAGQDTIGMSVYKRHNGLEGAVYAVGVTPVIASLKDRIDFTLENDGTNHNQRSFYISTDDKDSTKKAIYYKKDSTSPATKLTGTTGITGLKFERYQDAGGTTYENIIKITTVFEQDVTTRQPPYHIKVEYAEYAYLRNAE